MLFEHCFAGLPPVNARDLVASWRPGYGEWLAAQVAEGFDHTTTARFLEEKGIAWEEAKAGQRDPGWELRNDGATAGDALRRAFALKGWTPPDPEHAHAMTEADWKASPWYRKEIPFRPDMTATRARVMAANFDNRRYRDALIARGGEAYGGAGNMALGLGAALLGALPDPVNLLSLGGGMAAASRAATLGGALRAGARAGAVEGAAFTALADAVVLPDLATRGEDAAFADFALDTLAGGVLGSVFGAAGGLLARRSARRAAATADASPAATDAAGATADAAPFDASPDNGFLERATAPAPFDASPDGFLTRSGEGPATRPGETFHLGEPLTDFDAVPDNAFLERAGQGPRTRPGETIYLGAPLPDLPGPAPLPEGMHWKQRVELAFTPETPTGAERRRTDFARDQHGQSATAARQARIERARAEAPARNAALEAALREAAEKAAARNADNDLLRAGMTAADRDAAARSLALATTDLADGRPVDVAAVLEESGALERAYDSVLRDPLDGAPEDVLARLTPEDIEAVLVHRGPAVMRDGQIVVQGNALKKAGLGKRGYGLVKIIFLHGEKGNKHPEMPPVTREDVVALPYFVREYESVLEGNNRVWRIPRKDGNLLTIATSRQEDNNASMLVSMYIGESKPDLQISRKRTPQRISGVGDLQSRDTDPGITISHRMGDNGASHMTDSSLPDASAPVNRPAPDFSPAPEAPAPPRMTPDEARRAEANALAGQDEELRRAMEELEARGAADADELASAHADAESTEGIGREALDCAWTAEA